MTRDDAIKLARSIGIWRDPIDADSLALFGTAAQAQRPMSDEQRRAIEDAAYERAAQECDMAASDYRRSAPGSSGGYDWKADCAEDCAAAIRALKGDAK